MAAAKVSPASVAEVPIPMVEKEQVEIRTEEKLEGESLPFDPTELKAKYLEERDKRLARNLGINQYTIIDGHLSHYLTDPWVEPGFKRDPIEEKVDAVIIGGGYGAQVVAVRLIELGIENFRIIEKAGDFGGTWYWNRYPGAQCDIESYIYMPLLEEVGYIPSEKYARAKELLAHSRMIGEKFDLYRRALFQTEVETMRWNEEEGLWVTSTSRNDKIKSRYIIPAAGPLHRPKLPGVKGVEDFKGHSFHSSRWDFGYTGGDPAGNLEKLKNKRVGIIGTGATAVQIVPHLGEWAEKLYVFQRTPSSIDVRGNRPTDPSWVKGLQPGWQKKRMDNFDSIVNGGVEAEDMVADGWTDIIRELLTKFRDADIDPLEAAAQLQIADYKKMEQIRARCDSVVQNKETADSLKPWYNQFCKRPCFHDEYLQTFNRPNVELVDTKGKGVDYITEKGIVANGKEYEIDCLIYATGFELATNWTHRTGFEIYGRDGLTITEKWKDGAQTLHGWSTRGFPNCFIVQITQAALTPNFMHVTADQARHFAYVISEAQKRGVRTLEPTEEAEEEWTKKIVDSTAIRAKFFEECTPGYYNNEGTPSTSAAKNATYGYGAPAFLKILTDWRAEDKLTGLDLRFLESEGTDGSNQEAQDETQESSSVDLSSIFEDKRNIVEDYKDLQAKHQAEMNDLLRRQRDEIERLLGTHTERARL
ncbi:FAD/NAD(P)-binding domain-containing protein [Aaosphaeria arxii CBS 175.79]|uniref:FAD/NAD(P)-binding domain-containing protein n=1 Tax=Aaosphaeria arxii CBS 175.79 TaxID=1450172 RepID=A0A6A5XV30_9PLEO|nr:FAD/NAD(P)-binding domain-containing protein [Aaosphaeria arxii CBS 175.79]KAF2016786.1 FAD/NAD(P)-binding domain-containing protein [Aaosphaeria arxii CBS 175.79]